MLNTGCWIVTGWEKQSWEKRTSVLSVYRNGALLSMGPCDVIHIRVETPELGVVIGPSPSVALPIEEAYNKERWRN